MSGTCTGYKMCQCKTISRTWHRLEICTSVRPCLGHGIGTLPIFET
ncbi:hypothetical protein F383_33556 [Gossypium arboreum]|uniref:Uncharacterized protein n=1 Tax=Gossypium arboreum TaxID=29729 RepID=A0A0B0N626_GOSAR|nr:hypothetical protein F383_17640 [Gossypium arboreum]KHG06586.1 hypothetical protein F383_33556 [Gossypium arboreum]